MEISSNKSLLIVRYVIYIAVAASILILSKLSAAKMPWLVFLLLIYIGNTQLRIYIFNRKKTFIIASLIAEIIIISLLYKSFGGFTFIYYFIAVLDATMMLPKTQSLIMTILLYAAAAFQSMTPYYRNLQDYPEINIVFNTLIVIGFGTLGRYLQEEKKRKQEAQMLYDKLRISEQELKEAYSRLEQYSDTVEELTVLRERNRISREIHDTVGHTLSTLIIQLQALSFVVKSNPEKAEEMLGNMLSYTKNGLEDVRRAVKELSPKEFDSHSGIFAIQELVHNFEKNSGVKIHFWTSKNQFEMTADQSFTCYRIIQEAMNNSIKHGNASLIEININFSDNEIYMHIRDNGTGGENISKGFGLTHMEQRVKALGGRAGFTSEKDKGFELNIFLPKDQGAV